MEKEVMIILSCLQDRNMEEPSSWAGNYIYSLNSQELHLTLEITPGTLSPPLSRGLYVRKQLSDMAFLSR